jgi:hypothetical protein
MNHDAPDAARRTLPYNAPHDNAQGLGKGTMVMTPRTTGTTTDARSAARARR